MPVKMLRSRKIESSGTTKSRMSSTLVAALSAVAPYHADALDFLVNMLERALETLGLKLRLTMQQKAPASEPARIR